MRCVNLLFLFLLGITSLLHGQQAHYASIIGNVTDQSSAVLPGADVRITSVEAGVTFELKTNEQGLFQALNLTPGTYRVAVSAPGFRTSVREGIVLAGSQQARADFKLEVGAVTQSVEVKAASPQINTENATSRVAPISHYQTVTLPNTGGARHLDPYSQLSVGYADINNAAFSVGGALSGQNAEIQDGMRVSGQVDLQANNRGIVRPTVESVQELIVTTSNPTARYNEPAAIETILKSGTNDWHGSLFYQHGNRALNARGYFTHQKQEFLLHQYGGSIGGPVRKNKTFFFFAYGGIEDQQMQPFFGNFPTPRMKRGDFSELIDPAFLRQAGFANPIIVRDPVTGQPFVNNVIPAARIGAIAGRIASVYPDPNYDSGRGYISNQLLGSLNLARQSNFDIRVDHYFSPTQRTYGRFSYYNLAQSRDRVYFPDFWGNWFKIRGRVATVHHTSTVGSSFTNHAMLGVFFKRSPGGAGLFDEEVIPWNQRLGISGIAPEFDRGFPLLTFSQSTITTPATFGPLAPRERIYNFQDNVGWIRGRHSIQTGFEFRRDNEGVPYQWMHSFNCAFGCMTYSGRWSGFDFADLMLGLPLSAARYTPAPGDMRPRNEWAGYIQDDFRWTPRLSLSLGLRYNYFGPVTSEGGLMALFDPAGNRLVVPSEKSIQAIPRGVSLPMPVVTADQAGFPSSLLQSNKNDWQPRIGVAYRVLSNSVIRAGWGVYRTALIGTARRLLTGPFDITEDFPAQQPPQGAPPVLSLASPYQTSSTSRPLLNFFAPEKNLKNLLHYDYNFAVEHQIGANAFSAEYVGKKSIVPWGPDLNAVPASLTPFSRSRLPFPALGSIATLRNGAHYNFNALRLEARRRLIRGLFYDVTYVWSKTIDDLGGISGETAGTSEDPFNRLRDRAESPLIAPHRMTVNYIYQLPFGKGGALAFSNEGAGRVANYIIRGWETAGTYNFQTAAKLTPSGSYRDSSNRQYDAPNTNRLSGRSECTGLPIEPSDTQRSQGFVFNPDAFTRNVPAGRYGSCGRSVIPFGAATILLNQSFFRNFRIPWFVGDTGANFRFGFLMYNFINHSNGTNPTTNLDSAIFGKRANNKRGETRTMFFQARIDF